MTGVNAPDLAHARARARRHVLALAAALFLTLLALSTFLHSAPPKSAAAPDMPALRGTIAPTDWTPPLGPRERLLVARQGEP